MPVASTPAPTPSAGPDSLPGSISGLVFPIVDDGGVPQPNCSMFLADHDLLRPAGALQQVGPFTGVRIEVNGYFLPVDAGTYTAPTASVYEIGWVPTRGPPGRRIWASPTTPRWTLPPSRVRRASRLFHGGDGVARDGPDAAVGRFQREELRGADRGAVRQLHRREQLPELAARLPSASSGSSRRWRRCRGPRAAPRSSWH